MCTLTSCDKKASALRWNWYACKAPDWQHPQFRSMHNHCKHTACKHIHKLVICTFIFSYRCNIIKSNCISMIRNHWWNYIKIKKNFVDLAKLWKSQLRVHMIIIATGGIAVLPDCKHISRWKPTHCHQQEILYIVVNYWSAHLININSLCEVKIETGALIATHTSLCVGNILEHCKKASFHNICFPNSTIT